MAYFDHAQAAYENKCKEKYEELKENLRKSKDENDEMVWKQMMKIEYEAEKSKKKVKKYEEFFEMLQKLIPKQSSIHDVIN